MKTLSNIIGEYIRNRWSDDNWVFIGHDVSVIERIRRDVDDISHYIEFQKDKYWSKTGGKMCVNYYLVDSGFNEFMEIPAGMYLDHTRLGHLTSGYDEWYDISQGNYKERLDQILDEIMSKILPLSDRMNDLGEFMKIFNEVGVFQHYAYALYRGDRVTGLTEIIDRLRNRDAGDLLMKTLIRFGLIGDVDVSRIKLIQIQSTSDQKREIDEFIKEKCWLSK